MKISNVGELRAAIEGLDDATPVRSIVFSFVEQAEGVKPVTLTFKIGECDHEEDHLNLIMVQDGIEVHKE